MMHAPRSHLCPHFRHCGSADAGACSLSYAKTCDSARYFEGLLRGAAVPTTSEERRAILGPRACRYYGCTGGATA